MAEIRHLENRHDVILFCRGWFDSDKISQTGAEWRVDCGEKVEIETRCRIPIWRKFGRIQWHVIPEPRIALQGAATWWIHCHVTCLRATCHTAGVRILSAILKIVFRHILFFVFLNAVWALTSGGFRIVVDTLVCPVSSTHRDFVSCQEIFWPNVLVHNVLSHSRPMRCLLSVVNGIATTALTRVLLV